MDAACKNLASFDFYGASMAGQRSTPNRVLLVVCGGVFLSGLDQFIVNIAFPALGHQFGGSRAALSWTLNAYTIGFAALLAPAGRIADRFGRRRMFLLGLVVFCTASLGGATAWGIGPLIAFRLVQSIGAAMIMSTSLALLLHAFPPSRRPFAISVWSAVGATAATCGPPIGGLLVQSSWRWVFLVNLPVGLLVLLAGRRVLTESRDTGQTRLPDLAGTVLLVAGVAAITFGLVTGPDGGWARAGVLGPLAAGVLLIVATIARAARTPERLIPVLPLPLFRLRTFAVANLAAVIFMTGFGSLLLANVLFFTQVWHFSTAHAGLVLLPGPGIAALCAVPAGRLGHRFGAGPVIMVGAVLYACGCAWFVRFIGPEPLYVKHFLPGQAMVGVGVGLTMTNLSAAVSSTLSSAVLATGSATIAAARQFGTVLGVGVLFAVIGMAPATTPLVPFRYAWTVMGTIAALACLTAAFIGRARHVERPSTVEEGLAVAPAASG
jgi:EmrB/QacA subfamily drug resistance transporter